MLTPLAWVALAPTDLCGVVFGRADRSRAAPDLRSPSATSRASSFSPEFFTGWRLWRRSFASRGLALPLLLALLSPSTSFLDVVSRENRRCLAAEAAISQIPGAISPSVSLGASAWVVQEWVRGWLFSGFGWNGLGVALHARSADDPDHLDHGGARAFLVGRFREPDARDRRPPHPWRNGCELRKADSLGVQHQRGARRCCVFATASGRFSPRRRRRPLRVTAIQPNIPQNVKFSPDGEDEIFQQLSKLTQLAVGGQPAGPFHLARKRDTPRTFTLMR